MSAETAQEFGEELRRERELREVSREQLAEATKVSLRQIEALETGRYEHLPARVFSRGFVRSIALYLGLDADRSAAAFCHVHETWTAAEAERRAREQTASGVLPRLSKPRRAVSLNTTVLGLGVATALGLVTFAATLLKSNGAERPARAASRAATDAASVPLSGPASLALPPAISAHAVPLPSVPAPAPPALGGSRRDGDADAAKGAAAPPAPSREARPGGASDAPMILRLTFLDDCYAELFVDGKVAVAETFRKGTVREFSGRDRFTLSVNDAGAIGLTLDGKALSSLGEAGGVVKNHVIARGAVGG